jgi:hypothetical protein
MAAYGIPEISIAAVLGVDPKTLRKHYRDELDLGETKPNAQVAGFLFNSARSGNEPGQARTTSQPKSFGVPLPKTATRVT